MFKIQPSALQLLLPLYNGPDRHYHNLNHIYYCLSVLTELNNMEEFRNADYEALEYAIWFHDAIYSPYPLYWTSSEQESAELYHRWIREYGYIHGHDANDPIDMVKQCIIATKNHLSDQFGLSIEQKMMLDIDLASFAKPFAEVLKDSDKIFAEYACLGLSHETMKENRVKFLNSLLYKTRIYYTDYMFETYEARARTNIQGVIELSIHE